jgi:hypothetical protein
VVQDHHDVAADRLLHLDAGFRRQEMAFAIDITFETSAFFGHRAGVRKGKDLKPARVGQHRAIPVHKAMDAAKLFEHLGSGAKQEMIGVGQQHARPRHLERLYRLGFHSRLCTDWHEDGRLHLAMQRLKSARARFGARGRFIDREVHGHLQ